MEILKGKTNINFMGLRYWTYGLSVVLIALSVYIWVDRGSAKFGVDFTGGAEAIVTFEKPIDAGKIRNALDKAGVPEGKVQAFTGGMQNEFSIRMRAGETSDIGKRVQEALGSISENKATVQKLDFVGPVIGEEIRRGAWLAFIISCLGVLVYLAFRFEWRFGLGAIIALLHDGIISTGVYLLSGRDINAAFLAAILTVVGYSVNDTIIVFDRIRENLTEWYKQKGEKRMKRKAAGEKGVGELTLEELLNLSVNQTLSRTLLTGTTTLFICLTLWQLGHGEVSDLAFALFIGIAIGTFSSIFVASPVVLALAGKVDGNEGAKE